MELCDFPLIKLVQNVIIDKWMFTELGELHRVTNKKWDRKGRKLCQFPALLHRSGVFEEVTEDRWTGWYCATVYLINFLPNPTCVCGWLFRVRRVFVPVECRKSPSQIQTHLQNFKHVEGEQEEQFRSESLQTKSPTIICPRLNEKTAYCLAIHPSLNKPKCENAKFVLKQCQSWWRVKRDWINYIKRSQFGDTRRISLTFITCANWNLLFLLT